MTLQDEQKLRAGRGFFNFNGNNLEQVIGGWRCHNFLCATPDEVEQVLSNAYKAIEKSIINPVTVKNNGNFSSTNSK